MNKKERFSQKISLFSERMGTFYINFVLKKGVYLLFIFLIPPAVFYLRLAVLYYIHVIFKADMAPQEFPYYYDLSFFFYIKELIEDFGSRFLRE